MRNISKKMKQNAPKYGIRALTLILLVALIVGIGKVSITSVRRNLLEDSSVPTHYKMLFDNNDGTYNLSLNVTGQSEETYKKTNVVIVMDNSDSMYNNNTTSRSLLVKNGSSYSYGYNTSHTPNNNNTYYDAATAGNRIYYRSNEFRTTNSNSGPVYTGDVYYQHSQSRLAWEKEALYSLVDQLLDNNESDPNASDYNEKKDLVEISLVTFNLNSSTPLPNDASHNNYDHSTVKAAINAVGHSQGTNWEMGLRAGVAEANKLKTSESGESLFVIFLTDGEPTAKENSTSYDLNYYDNWNAAKDEAKQAAEINKTDDLNLVNGLYTIFTYSNNDTHKNYLNNLTRYAYGLGTYDSTTFGASNTLHPKYFDAQDTTALVEAFRQIAEDINTNGFHGVTIKDGTTKNVTASSGTLSGGLLDIDDQSFKYYLSFPITTEGNTITSASPYITDITLVSGNTYKLTNKAGDEYTVERVPCYTKNSSNQNVVNENGFQFEWKDGNNPLHPGVNPPTATVTANHEVDWDLNSLDVLLNDVTYNVSFDVWPSQITLDIIADLKNNSIQYGAASYTDIDGNEHDLSGVWNYITEDYQLLTNTNATVDYYDSREENQTLHTASYINPDPVSTASVEQVSITKNWTNSLDERTKEPIVLNIDRDDVHHYIVDLNKDNDWKSNFFESIGIMTIKNGTVSLKTSGHDFSFSEDQSISYHWEIDADTIRPMSVNGEVKKLVLLDSSEVPSEMTGDYYESGSTKYVKLTINDETKYYRIEDVSSGGIVNIEATNYRRSYLDIQKKVTGDDAPEDAMFGFTATITSSLANLEDNEVSDEDQIWFSIYDIPNEGEEGTIVFDNIYTNATAETRTVDSSDSRVSEFNYNSETGITTYKWNNGKTSTVKCSAPSGTVYSCVTGYYYINSGSTISFKLKNNWNFRSTNLPVDSTYTVTETDEVVDADGNAITGFAFKDLNGNGNGTKVFSGAISEWNTGYKASYTNEYMLTHVEVTKVWDDNDNQDGIRPNVKIDLYADGRKTQTIELNGEVDEGEDLTTGELSEWVATFGELPVYKDGTTTKIVYTVKEDTSNTSIFNSNGYTASDPVVGESDNEFTITNTHTPETVTIEGTKTWKDGPGENRPNVTINLLADNTKIDSVTLPAQDGSWDYSFENLPKYKNVTNAADGTVTHGVPIVYTITENPVSNYSTEIDGYDVINTLVTSIEVTKTWDDGDKTDRPTSVTVRLLADGTEVDSIVLNSDNEWKHTFTDLPVYNGTEEIEYTITEDAVSGYNTHIEEYAVTNVLKRSITVTKEWSDANNQDGIRPGSVEITLKANGETVGDPVTLSSTNNWTYTFEDLDKYENGVAINYTIVETAIEGYTPSYVATETGYKVVNTHTPGKTSVTVSKEWSDANNQDGIRPGSVTIALKADGVDTGKTVTLNAGNNWTDTFSDLDEKANGQTISYTVEETAIEGYTPNVEAVEGGYKVTNTHTPEKTEVTVSKEWSDANNQDGIRPGSVTITLKADGQSTGKTVTLSESNNWTDTFSDLDKKKAGKDIEYTVEETAIEGYTPSIEKTETGYKVTNTHTPETTEVTVTKVWEDADDQDGIRPDDITISLLADGVDTGKTVTLNETNGWTDSFTNLDKKKAGTDIVYTVSEVKVEGYDSSTEETDTGYEITNTHTPEKTEVSGTKTWEDANDQDGYRPGSIIVNLLIDGKATGTKEVVIPAEDGSWTYTFANLDKYAGGELINYSVSEDEVAEYTTTYSETGYDITNTHAPEKTEVTVTKSWDDANNQDGKRPGSVTITLLADGESTGKTVTLSDTNNWTDTFSDLDKKKGGVVIAYTVEETAIDGYTPNIEKTETGYKVTNTHTPETTEVSGVKHWEDSDNQDGLRPKTITITLYADGEPTSNTTTTSEADDWAFSFTNLPKYKAGKEITYSVIEDSVDKYDTSYAKTGYDITNTYSPEVTSVSGTKTWNDANDQDGYRPSSVTVTLWIDGVESKQTATLNERNGWSYSFDNLPRYRDEGVAIQYEVKEEKVPEYTTTYQGNDIINTHTPEVISISGTKTWDDADDQDGKRPKSIVVNLLADGEQYKSVTVVPDIDGNWTYDFLNVPKKKAGKDINYTIEEEKVPNYTTSYDGNNITNSYTPEITSISVKKNWVDEDDRDGARPESITFNLTATVGDDKTVISKTVTEDDGWSYTFDKLPVYAGGKMITYTVSEDEVTSYDTSEDITGSGTTTDPYVITNTHTPEKINISGVKTWDDNNDENGMRPSEIYITLYADGNKKETKKVTAGEDANNWSFEFTDLYKYENKKEIAYTIKETDANGNDTTIQDYVSEVTGNFKDGYKVENTYSPDTISITIDKEWVDGNNAEGIRPTSITIHLLADGTLIKDATVTAGSDGKWTYTFDGLNKYKNKKEIKYTVTEDTVAEYTTNIQGYVIVNTYDPNNYSVSGTKTWDDNDDAMGMRPDSIIVYLSGKDGSEEVVSKELEVKPVNGEWKYTFTGLPKYHNGNLINYTVSEANIQDYSAEVNGYDIKNTYTPDTITVSGTKTWSDADNQDGIRPESITVILLADGQETGKTATVTADDEGNWEFAFEGLTKYKNKQEIVYTVKEAEVDGYTPSIVDYSITNTHKPATISFTASKEWYDEDDNDGIRPTSITVKLFKTVNETRTLVKSQEITAAGNWTYTFEDLPKFEGGVLIVYDIEEEEVAGYVPDVQEALVGDTSTTQVIYNTHEPEITAVSGYKEWDDNNDQDGIRPDTIVVHLYANGVEIDSMEVSEETDWYYEFDNLRVFENQQEIEYTIVEDSVEGYETSYDGYNVINTHTLERINITVTKVWEDYDNYDKIRPESVSVDLLANGEVIGTFELNESNNWTMVIEGLFKYANGKEIEYTLEEHEVEFYIATYTSSDYDYTITNTHEPQKGDTDIIEPPHTGVDTFIIPFEYVLFYDDRKKYYF